MIKESVCCWLSCYQSHGRQYAGREETEGFMRVRGFIIIQLNVNKFFVCGIFLSLFLFIIITIMIFFGPPVSVCIVSYAKGSLLLFFYGLPLFQLVFFSSGLCVLFLYSGDYARRTDAADSHSFFFIHYYPGHLSAFLHSLIFMFAKAVK